jgi:group I intron endonuclease
MYGYIYLTTFIPTNKIYVGKRAKSKFDESYVGSGVKIKNLIKKYGKSQFETHIIDIAENDDELQQKEIYWIDKYSATNPQIGYNIALGGNGAQVEHQTDETKRKISESNLGKKRTQEVKEQMSKDRLGSKWMNNGKCNKLIREKELSNYIYEGSPWKFGILPGRKSSPKSEESKLKCSNSHKGKKHNESWNKNHNESIKSKGFHWYTNGKENLHLSSDQEVPEGFYRGRYVSEETKQKCGLKNIGRTPWNKK